MCAKDRSQIVVSSQTESIASFATMLDFSSCPAFIRNAQGALIYANLPFDNIFLTSGTYASWFSSLPLEMKIRLMKSEIKSLSDGCAVLVKRVRFNDVSWTVFIERIQIGSEIYSKWVFINEGGSVSDGFIEYADFSIKMERFIEGLSKTTGSEWTVFNLYIVGFTHATISRIAGVKEQTSRNIVKHIKDDLGFPDRDYIILAALHSLDYGRYFENAIGIVKGDVGFL